MMGRKPSFNFRIISSSTEPGAPWYCRMAACILPPLRGDPRRLATIVTIPASDAEVKGPNEPHRNLGPVQHEASGPEELGSGMPLFTELPRVSGSFRKPSFRHFVCSETHHTHT